MAVNLPPPPETLDEAFDRRDLILSEMLADPRTWEGHLAIAAALLMQDRQMFQDGRLWDLLEVQAEARQLVFAFSARQPNTLLSLPEWRGDAPSLGEMFTDNAFQCICQRPETAALWDLHTVLYQREGVSVMTIRIYRSNHGPLLREVPVELLPCADRYAVSDG